MATEHNTMTSQPGFGTGTQGAVVLVVENEVIVCMSVAQELRDHGFEAVEAHTGDEAIQIVEARDDIDVVFSDINMPGRINGTGPAEWLGKARPNRRATRQSTFCKNPTTWICWLRFSPR